MTAQSSLGARPTLAWIDKAVLTVDPSYQRTISGERSQKLIAKLAATFSWAHCAPLIAAAGPDMTYTLIDGQHRHAAAMRRDDIKDLPCYVIDATDRAAQVAAFVAHNRDRVALTSLALFHASVGAGDAIAVRVVSACREAEVEILPATMSIDKMPPNVTMATGICSRIAEEEGAGALTDVLKVIREAHPKTPGQLRSNTIAAVAMILRLKLADRAALIAALRGTTGLALEDDARAMRAQGFSIRDAFVVRLAGLADGRVKDVRAVILEDEKRRAAARARVHNAKMAAQKKRQPFRFDRSQPSATVAPKPVEVRGSRAKARTIQETAAYAAVKVRKFEAGDFYTLVNRALQAAGITYTMIAGKAHQYRVAGRKLTLSQLVKLANEQRAKEGKEPLPMPKGTGLGRPGKKRRAA